MYNGIKADTLFLAAQNRFEDSKIFYEEHRQELKDGFIIPMRQIAAEMGELMLSIDDMMVTDPQRMVSRLYRDSRFSGDKHRYRDNLWIMFMRNKNEWLNYPCMWFEVKQDCWVYGVGMFYVDAAYLELYRKALIERPQEFLKAAKKAEKAGAAFAPVYYKKQKPGEPVPEVEKYYNVKYMCFTNERKDFKTLESEKLIDELKQAYAEYADMYKFLKSISDERAML